MIKVITLYLTFIIFNSLFAEEGYRLKAQIFENDPVVSNERNQQVMDDYFVKIKELGLSEYFKKNLFFYRINLNQSEAFKELGISLKELSEKNSYGDHFDELALVAPFIFTGTVHDSISPLEATDGKHFTAYKIKVDEILKGEGLYRVKPKVITCFFKFGHYGWDDIGGEVKYNPNGNYKEYASIEYVGYHSSYSIGDKVLIYSFSPFLKKGVKSERINGHEAGLVPPKSWYEDYSPFSVSGQYIIYSVKDKVGDDKNIISFKKFEKAKKYIKEIGVLNDRKNFFNRNYSK